MKVLQGLKYLTRGGCVTWKPVTLGNYYPSEETDTSLVQLLQEPKLMFCPLKNPVASCTSHQPWGLPTGNISQNSDSKDACKM